MIDLKGLFGGAEGDRTPDLLTASRGQSQTLWPFLLIHLASQPLLTRLSAISKNYIIYVKVSLCESLATAEVTQKLTQ